MAKLLLGCGYLGHRVARRWLALGETVLAVTRSPQRAESLRQEGLHPIVADVTRPESLAGLPGAETVLYSVGYDRGAAAGRHAIYVEGLLAALEALPSAPRRILHASSTGVYGGAEAAWVDEDAPCRPRREAGRALLAAETALRAHRLGARAVTLRLAGLYGPGRIPRIADLLAGHPLALPSGGSVNLVHVDDVVSAVLAAEARAEPPRIYNVSDGHPVGRRELYRFLADLLGLPEPRFVEPPPEDVSPRWAEEKWVSNARMRSELGVSLAYPSYCEGLSAIAAGGEWG
jgi:nucleoside-diphosphate-sugar epimerase